MKTVKQRPDLLLRVLVPLFVFLSLCYYLYPNVLHYIFYFNWASAAACLVILLLPSSNRTIGDNSDSRSLLRRYSITWLTQILLSLSFILICHLIGKTHANSSEYSINIYQLGRQFFTHYGLYPWPTYCIIALSMAWLAYDKKSDASFAASTALAHTGSNDPLGITLNSIMRNISFFSISLSLSAVIITTSNLFYHNIFTIHSAWEAPQTACCFFFLLLYFLSTKRKVFHKKFFKKIELFPVLFFFSITTALFVGLLYGLINLIGIKPFQPPFLLNILYNHSWEIIWQLTASLWWLSWTPLMAIQLAKQCKGISIRSSVIMLLSLPFISYSLFYGFFDHSQIVITRFNHLFTTDQAYVWISLIATIILFLIITTNSNRHAIVNHELPATDKIKYRPFTHTQENSVHHTLIYLTLFILGGCYLLNLLLVVVIPPCIIYTLLLITGKTKQAWQKNNSSA